ncbi:MAG: hypothetical protein ABIH92_05645 [Nanoarchaeota archaeon]
MAVTELNTGLPGFPRPTIGQMDAGVYLDRAWELTINGVKLRLERWGNFCVWDQIKLLRDGEEVYNLMLCGEIRQESFFRRPYRPYYGNRHSFVEYVGTVAQNDRIPNVAECVKCFVDEDVATTYRENLLKMLE